MIVSTHCGHKLKVKVKVKLDSSVSEQTPCGDKLARFAHPRLAVLMVFDFSVWGEDLCLEPSGKRFRILTWPLGKLSGHFQVSPPSVARSRVERYVLAGQAHRPQFSFEQFHLITDTHCDCQVLLPCRVILVHNEGCLHRHAVDDLVFHVVMVFDFSVWGEDLSLEP